MVDGFIGNATTTSVGMPEGDSLSVFSMIQLDLAFHRYQKALAPEIQTISYVDNLVITAEEVQQLAQGWVSLQTFFELWNLETDISKSYCWATTDGLRKGLKAFPMTIVDHATELGGALSFSRKKHGDHLRKRLALLDPKWESLKKSTAPLPQKFQTLYTVFWPKGLHGVNALDIPPQTYKQLRTTAVKALKIFKAGSNPLLRLTLQHGPLCDPEYYVLVRAVNDFRRLCSKNPSFVQNWKDFMSHFDGIFHPGPFSTLLRRLNQIQWRLPLQQSLIMMDTLLIS